jgi:hypothetical protein
MHSSKHIDSIATPTVEYRVWEAGERDASQSRPEFGPTSSDLRHVKNNCKKRLECVEKRIYDGRRACCGDVILDDTNDVSLSRIRDFEAH